MADSQNVLAEVALPIRRREQLRRVLAGQPIGEASIAVGYKNPEAGSKALSDTRRRLAVAMESSGLTPTTFVRDYLLPLLNATQTVYATKDGMFTDERVTEDSAIRMAALRETGKLMALYPKEQDSGPTQLNININNGTITNE
jgi:hypothetical protein